MSDNLDAVRAAINSAVDVDVPDAGQDAPPVAPAPDAPAPKEAEGAQLPLNDDGNGRRFELYYGEDAIYIPRLGWHVWDGCRWALDPDGIAVRGRAQGLQDRIAAEIPHLVLPDWQLDLIATEPDVLRRLGALEAIKAADRTVEQAIEVEDLSAKLGNIRKTKQRLGGMRADHRNFAKTTGNSGRIDALLKEAVTRQARLIEDLDSDPLCVNTRAGVLQFDVTDLREEGAGKVARVKLAPHKRVLTLPGSNRPQYITKLAPVDYDPAAECPEFMAFLERVQPDPDMRAFLQRWFGLSMSALPVQKFLYMYGMGANGKSLLANLMRRMMGDYATMVRIESLTGQNRRGGADATPDLMRLIGARAAITNEPEEGGRLQEQKIKEMTGGDAMMVRQLHADFVEFTPMFKLTFTGNHKLEIRGTDDGIWRRPLLCPFDIQIPDAQRDEKLGDRLFETERAGILNWLVDGLIDYLERGLQEPAQVLNATQDYRRDSDPIGDFLASACVIEGGADWMPARDLIHACYLYQLENTAHAWTPGGLAKKLKARADKYMHPDSGRTYRSHKRSVTGYSGIRLTTEMQSKLNLAPRDSKGLPLVKDDAPDSGGDY